jgi:uncharacterized membrane protein YfcA
VAIPLLAHLLPLQFVVPWILVLDFTASVVLGSRAADRRAIRWSEIRWLLPGTVAGVLLGVTLLMSLPKPPLLAGLGVFVMAFGLRSLLYLHGSEPVTRWWAVPAGLIGGTVGAVFGTGGPPYVVYLTHRIHDKAALRATFSGLFMLDGGLRVIIFVVAGLLLQAHMLWACLLGLPVMALGLYSGHKVHVGLSQAQMVRIIGALLLMSGGSLLVRAWS